MRMNHVAEADGKRPQPSIIPFPTPEAAAVIRGKDGGQSTVVTVTFSGKAAEAVRLKVHLEQRGGR